MSFDVTRDPLPSGFLAIEASAGTGKTWTLSHLVARLLLSEPDLELGRILVVTFTNASADELAARVRRVLGECRAAATGRSGATDAARTLVAAGEQACGGAAGVAARLDRCLGALDELAVGTIHSFCRQVLQDAAFDCGEAFAAELAPDDGELIAEAVRDAWRTQLWRDPRLASFASAWSIEGDVEVWRRWNRRPGTRIEPAIAIADALAAAAAAEAAVRAAATPQALAEVGAWSWKKGCEPDDDLALLASGGDLAGLAILVQDPADTVFKKDLARALAHPLPAICRQLRESARLVRIAWLGWLCPAVAERLRSDQAVAGVWTQDDLLRRVRDALVARPALAGLVRQRWPIALIDEFQDTDPVQWEIFRRCHAEGGGRLVVVGDPKQAVYRFRGADLAAYLAAVATARSERLTCNWRSDPALVTAVQALIGRTGRPFLTPSIALAPVEGRNPAAPIADGDAALTVLQPDPADPARRQDAVASEIVRLLGQQLGHERIQPRDCAVLVRSASQAREMREALLRRGVPATMAVHGDVLDSPAAAELHAVLAALARPRDGQALRLALATRAWGLDAASLAATVADDQAWQILVEQVEGHHQRWQRFGLTAAIDGWAAGTGALARFAALPDGERWLTDWRHAIEMLHGAASANGLRPAALLAWWERRGSDGAEARRLRLDGDASAVRILTMHKAKGLEFPIVFCPFVGHSGSAEEDGVLVNDASGSRLVFAGAGLAAAMAAAQEEDDAEQLRLAYVALTRARVRSYVLWGMWDRRKQYALPLQSALGWWLRPDEQPHAAWRAATASHVDGRDRLLLDSDGRLDRLRAAGVAILRRPARADWQRWQAPDPRIDGDGLRRLPPAVRAVLDRPRCVTSFTGLIGGEAAPEQRRNDEPGEGPGASAGAQLPTGMRAIARGADLGDALHRALEGWDFASDPSGLVRDALRPLGLESGGPRQPYVEDAVATVAAGLAALASLPIRCDGRELVLGAVPDRLRRVEWEFHLPLAQVRPERVVELIARHGAVPAAVLRALRLRDAAPGGGYLKGFVDLLASDGTAWWVLDWKSNHLGDAPEDYAADRLWPAMAGHHYLAQALIYVLALHRHLRHRLGAAYRYDTHVAGAAWIFLRGVDCGHGVWTWKPPEVLVLALEHELLGVRA